MAPRSRRRPRGHIEQLPSGKYRAIVYAGTDPLTGKRRDLKETADDYDAAEVALTRLQNQVDEERHPRTDITLTAAIAQWLDVARHEDTTRERYDDLIRLYITPTVGKLQAGRIDAELLEKLYARLQRCRDLCSGRRTGHTCKPLSSATVRKIHYIIRGALDRAVRYRQLGVNKAAMAEPPAPAPANPDPPSAREAAALLNAAFTEPEWGTLLWLTMVTGSRRGELCAVRWQHLDVDNAIIWLPRSIAQTKNGLKEKDTKTGQRRRIALDEYTLTLLAEHRQRWEQRCADLDSQLAESAFLFSGSPDGSEPLVPHSVTNRYRRLAQRLKLRSTRLHSLRHYSATELIAAGVDIRTVAGRLGHGSGGATTLKVYAAWVTEADQRAAETIARIMPRPVPAPRAPRGPYEVIAAALREDITSGRLQPGDQLPTVVELSVLHDVSVGTAHRAIAVLKLEGLITATRGRRATVTSNGRHDT